MQRKRVVLVTGASHGLGAAIASRLGKDGFRVALNYCHSLDLADKTARGIAAAGGEVKIFRADVTLPEDVKAMVREIKAAWGDIEILVNNATGPQPERPIEEYAWKDFENQIDFFIKAPVHLMQEVIGPMKRARWGKVINIGSEVTENCRPIFSPYIAAKCALLGLTRSWAIEFGPWNIAVNSIAPGWIPTERHADAAEADLEGYRSKVPMGRQGVPEDVASAVSYLANEETNFVSGQQFCINGANTTT